MVHNGAHADDRGRRADLRGARRRRAADLRAGDACCRWRSATSCSEAARADAVRIAHRQQADRRRPRPRAGAACAAPRPSSSTGTRARRAASRRPTRPAGALGVFLPRGRHRPRRRRPRRRGRLADRGRGGGAADPGRHAPRRHGAPLDLLRAAYHLGNRHVPLEVRADRLQLEPDHVLAEHAARMGLHVERRSGAVRARGGRVRRVDASHATAHGHDHARARHDARPARSCDARPRSRRTTTSRSTHARSADRRARRCRDAAARRRCCN